VSGKEDDPSIASLITKGYQYSIKIWISRGTYDLRVSKVCFFVQIVDQVETRKNVVPNLAHIHFSIVDLYVVFYLCFFLLDGLIEPYPQAIGRFSDRYQSTWRNEMRVINTSLK
jgi:hypothetical protein